MDAVNIKRALANAVINLALVLAVIAVFAALLAIPAAYGELMYNDWRCGFSQCRRIVP